MSVVIDPPTTALPPPAAPGGVPPTRPHRLRRLLIWTVVALIGAIGAVVPVWLGTRSGPVTGDTAEQRAVSYVTEQLRADGVPDAAFAVVRDGEIVESGSLGAGVTVDSPFRIGSLSKPFTATAVLQLVEAGTVDLDAPVTDYLPDFRTATDQPITVRHLLNQTSGLPTWAGTVDLTQPQTPLQQRVDAVAEVMPISAPGTEFHYNNKNFATLGLLVQTVTGQPFAQYLQHHVLDPLGMDRTFTDGDSARRAGLVDGSSVWFGGHVSHATTDFPGALPDGALISTVRDLARFAGAQTSDVLLPDRTVRAMHSGVIDSDIDGARYAMGWRESQVNGQTVVAHEGDLDVYHSDLGILPETGTGLVVLTAHNSQLWDATAAWHGGMQILAGGPAPEIGGSYRLVNGMIAVIGVLVLVLLAAGTVGVVRRLRDPQRANGWIAVAYLIGSALVLAGFFVGLRLALADDVVFTPQLAFSSFAPDITTLVVVGGGWLALAGGLLGVMAVVRRGRRSRRFERGPATA